MNQAIPVQTAVNPLAKHFRQPALYVKLTSNGKFWEDGAIEIPVTGEIPVYPMTAKDEIVLRTPDALINGTSVVSVIESCCPNIKNAWAMPSIDVDSTLIAIRIASYGQYMSVSAECPECKEEHDYDVDLQEVLTKIQAPNYNEVVKDKHGLAFKLKPLNYRLVSQAGTVMFEEERLIQTLGDTDVEESVRMKRYESHLQKMIEFNLDNVTNCTASITADGNVEVTDPQFIKEYYANADGTVLRLIQDKIKEFADAVAIKPVSTLCTACSAEFKLNIEFDYARFFDKGF
jgi:hypothetical protein